MKVEGDEGTVRWKYYDDDDDDGDSDDDNDGDGGDSVDIAFIGKSNWGLPISRNGPINVAQWPVTWIENKLSYSYDHHSNDGDYDDRAVALHSAITVKNYALKKLAVESNFQNEDSWGYSHNQDRHVFNMSWFWLYPLLSSRNTHLEIAIHGQFFTA